MKRSITGKRRARGLANENGQPQKKATKRESLEFCELRGDRLPPALVSLQIGFVYLYPNR